MKVRFLLTSNDVNHSWWVQAFGVKRVIAKVNDPIRASTYRGQGIYTFSRTTILGTLLEAMLMGDAEVGKVLIEKSKQAEAAMAGELG